jgi:hypothetical protein
MEGRLLMLVLLVALTGVVAAQFVYDLHIQTGPLKPQTGRLFVILRSSKQVNNISMSASPLKLKPFSIYSSAAQSPIAAPQVAGASFQWTTTNRTASAITIKKVTVIPKYLKEPYRSQFTKNFCLNGIAFPSYVIPMTIC